MAELRDLLSEANDIKQKLKSMLEGKSVEEANAIKKTNDEYKKQISLLKNINEQVKNQKEINTEQVESIVEQESGLKSMTSIYQSMGNIEKQRLEHLRNTNTSITSNVESLSKMQDINKQISELTSDDITKKELLQRQYEAERDSLDKRGAGIREQIRLSDEVNSRARAFSNMTERQKDMLQKQLSVYDGIKDTIGGILDTASMVTSSIGGVIGMLTIGAGIAADKITDVNKQLGFTVRELNNAGTTAAGLGFFFEDTAGTVRGLTNEFGTMEAASGKTQLQVGLMATNLGISNTEAASLVGSFARMNEGSTDIAANMIATTKEFAKQNNVIPSDVLSDLAGNAEAFALYAKNGGENLIEAAVGAKQLGTDLGTVTGIADTLLDFESSITSELELAAILGRSINLNKARGLAYDGDQLGMMEEISKQMGGITAFNQMDVFQKRQAAQALGVSVAELQKILSNSENVEEQSNIIKQTFSEWGNVIDAGLNKYLGTSLKGLGGMIMMAGQFNMGLSMMQKPLSRLGSGLSGAIGKMGRLVGLGKKAGKVGGSLGSMVGKTNVTGPVSKIPETSGKGVSSLAKGIQKINPGKLIAGAGALVIAAGAVWVLGKGLQEFKGVEWKELFVMAAGIGVLALALAALGAVGPVVLIGAAALLVAAGAVWVFGKALQEITKGLESLNMIGDTITGLVSKVGGILALSASFTSLAASVGLLGAATTIALPALLGLSVAGKGIEFINNIFGSGEKADEVSGVGEGGLSEYESQMLRKMDTLINEVKSNRDIYLDKEKVTNVVMKTSERRTKNIFGLEVA